VSIEGANNAAFSFASPVPEIYFLEKKNFCHCVERTQERPITFLSVLAEHKTGSAGEPGQSTSLWWLCGLAQR
jgi:hypothetical protein